MANLVQRARTNAFTVTDRAALESDLAGLDIEVHTADEDRNEVVLFSDTDTGGWPAWRETDDDDEDIEFDIAATVAKHLAPQHVAVFIEISSEKLRSLGGIAVAINHRGERARIDLDDIYEQAANLGEHITRI
jgi:hypothetical protein